MERSSVLPLCSIPSRSMIYGNESGRFTKLSSPQSNLWRITMEKNFEEYLAKLAPTVASSAKPTILLLQCIDWRYAHRIVDMMDRMGLRGKYDVFALAGAAAGANKVDEWRDALISHIKTARTIK